MYIDRSASALCTKQRIIASALCTKQRIIRHPAGARRTSIIRFGACTAWLPLARGRRDPPVEGPARALPARGASRCVNSLHFCAPVLPSFPHHCLGSRQPRHRTGTCSILARAAAAPARRDRHHHCHRDCVVDIGPIHRDRRNSGDNQSHQVVIRGLRRWRPR